MIPPELYYTESHQWVRIEDGQALVGFTGRAFEETGEISAVELPSRGDEVAQMEVAGALETDEGSLDVAAPLSGQVVEVNDDVLDHPEVIARDPFGDGWLFKIKLKDPSEVEALLDAEAYRHLIEEG